MKMSLKIIGVFLIFTLLTSCVAATENKDFPTKEEITGFIAGIPVSDNYINTVVDAVKDKQPAWKCDIWVDKNDNQMLSLYYVDPDSAKGYNSIYFNEFGKEISLCGVEVELVYQYKGKDVSEENTDNTVEIADETDQTDSETVETADETDQTDSETVETADETDQTDSETVEAADETDQNAEYDERLAEYDERLAEYEKQLAEYEREQSVKYDPSTKYKIHTVYEENQSAEYEELLAEYKELLDEYQEAQKVGIVTPPTEPEEPKWNTKIVIVLGVAIVAFLILTKIIIWDKKAATQLFFGVVTTLIAGFLLYKCGWI